MSMSREWAEKIVAYERTSQAIKHENDHLRDILPPPVADPRGPNDLWNQLLAEADDILRRKQ